MAKKPAEKIEFTYQGTDRSGKKVKGTLHWVSASHSFDAEIRLYDRLFKVEEPGNADVDYRELLNPDSLKVLENCKLEPSLKDAEIGDSFQFQRLGYFCVDKDSTDDKMVFNRTVPLRDSWSNKK